MGKARVSIVCVALGTASLLAACENLHMPVADLKAGRSTSKALSYRADVLPVLKSRCALCHNATSGLPNWLDYATAYAKRERIYQLAVASKAMPKGMPMPDEERTLIGEWIKAGAPETAPGDEPVETPANPADPGSSNPPANPTDPAGPNQPDPAVTSGPVPPPATSESLNYDEHILPLVKRLCSGCHNATSYAPNWLDYKVAYAKRDRILERVFVKRDMPMVGVMTDAERQRVADWVRAGAPKEAPVPVPTPTNPGGTPGTPTEPTPPTTPVTPPPADGPVTYDAVLKPLVFQPVCGQCHNEQGKPELNWLNYEAAYRKRDRIYKYVVNTRQMPPAGVAMDEDQRSWVERWYRGGGRK